jgi:hypothetical protein
MAIRWDKFTLKAQEAIQRGDELASEHGNLLRYLFIRIFWPAGVM